MIKRQESQASVLKNVLAKLGRFVKKDECKQYRHLLQAITGVYICVFLTVTEAVLKQNSAVTNLFPPRQLKRFCNFHSGFRQLHLRQTIVDIG